MTGARRVDVRSDLWKFTVESHSNAHVALAQPADWARNTEGATFAGVSADGKMSEIAEMELTHPGGASSTEKPWRCERDVASRLRKKGFRGAVRAAGMTARSLDEASLGWSDRLRRPRPRGL